MAKDYIYRQGTTGQTKTALSTRVKLYTSAVDTGRFTKMGVTSSFNLSESKRIETIRGLGYGDQIAENIPGVTDPINISIDRASLYLANLMQQFGYKAGVSGMVRSLKHHKWPFDIKTEILLPELLLSDSRGLGQATKADVDQEGGLNNTGNPGLYAIVTVYEGCWIASYSTNYQVEQAGIVENCSLVVSDVYDVLGSVAGLFISSGNSPEDITGASLRFGL